jgi:transcriptional regulator with XRE-family HTH domain
MAYTISDVARLAGVSRTTVSRVLNGSEKVSRETRIRVQTAIAKVQYSPNTNAAELRRGGRVTQERGQNRRQLQPVDPDADSRTPQDRESQTAEAARLCLLEGENRRLRRLVTRLTLDLGRLVNDLTIESK